MHLCYALSTGNPNFKTLMCSKGNGVPLLATFAAFFFARRPRGTPAGAAETHAPAAPASAPLWQLRCAGAPRSRECCCARSRPRPSARRLVLRAPLPQGAAAWPRETCASGASAPGRRHHDRTCVKVSTFIRWVGPSSRPKRSRRKYVCCQKTIYKSEKVFSTLQNQVLGTLQKF